MISQRVGHRPRSGIARAGAARTGMKMNEAVLSRRNRRSIAILGLGLGVIACDHTSDSMVYGRARMAGNAPAPAHTLVLVNPEHANRYFTLTNSNGEYSCPMTEFVGPLGTIAVMVRALDGQVVSKMIWDKGKMIATRIDVTVRDTTADLRLALGDSLGRQYRRCGE